MDSRSSRLRFLPLRSLLAGLAVCCVALAGRPAAAQQAASEELEALQERTIKTAVAKVAPSVVQIETTGGTDVVGSGPRGSQIRRGTGPTTGVIVAPDGYIISSAFNFANKPSGIFVAVPGQKERFVAKVLATDHTRMLTLLKIEATGLPVPAPAPKDGMRIGQSALALGRTWTSLDNAPSVSIGIISALGRIWGKAIQTDAKVSPVNYGGPLIDLQGRVLGVLVPAAPRAEDETAGVEWYDSGIGFAIPLEDINKALPQLRQGQDLKKGLLGITLQSADIYAPAPTIASIAPESAAAKAGIQPGDVVTEINGVPITRQAQILHILGGKYEGDTVSVKIKRDKDEINLPDLKLTGVVSAFIHPFLGILPVRDDPEPGEEIRYVFPKSPAEAAGLKAGDRILKVGVGEGTPRGFTGRDPLTSLLNRITPGTKLKLEVRRKDSDKKVGEKKEGDNKEGEKKEGDKKEGDKKDGDKKEADKKDGDKKEADKKEGDKNDTVTVTLGVLSADVPADLPEKATVKKALAGEPKADGKKEDEKKKPPGEPKADPKKDDEKKGEDKDKKEDDKKAEDKDKPETGFLKRTNAAGDRPYWVYVPENYDPNISYALVLWLHPEGKGTERDMEAVAAVWKEACKTTHLILVAPQAENVSGWLASEIDAVEQIVREVMGRYTIDAERVVVHGMGLGGQMAYYLAFHARDLVRGVAVTGAALASQPKDNVADQRLFFFVVTGAKDTLAPDIQETKTKLTERRFPVVFRELPDVGRQYLNADTLQELVRWIDTLDRQ